MSVGGDVVVNGPYGWVPLRWENTIWRRKSSWFCEKWLRRRDRFAMYIVPPSPSAIICFEAHLVLNWFFALEPCCQCTKKALSGSQPFSNRHTHTHSHIHTHSHTRTHTHTCAQFPPRRGEGNVRGESPGEEGQCCGLEGSQEDCHDQEIRQGHLLGTTWLSHLWYLYLKGMCHYVRAKFRNVTKDGAKQKGPMPIFSNSV